MQIDFGVYFSGYRKSTDWGKRYIESFELIKWVMKARDQTKGIGARPRLQHVYIENSVPAGWSQVVGTVAEAIATDGLRIHHALISLPVMSDLVPEGLYEMSVKGKILTIDSIDSIKPDCVFPNWRAVVDKNLFTLTEGCSKFPRISDKFLAEGIPPRIDLDSESVWIRYTKENCPVLISRPTNDDNYAIVMPRYH